MRHKKIFMSYWFYVFGFVLCIILNLAECVIGIYVLLTRPDQIPPAIFFIVCGAFFFIFLFFFAGEKLLQWTIIDEKGLRVKCLYKTIIKKGWDEIKDIYIKLYPVSVSYGFHIKYIIFDDGRNLPTRRNGINTKKDYIAIRYGKRALDAVKQFWDKEIEDRTTKSK